MSCAKTLLAVPTWSHLDVHRVSGIITETSDDRSQLRVEFRLTEGNDLRSV